MDSPQDTFIPQHLYSSNKFLAPLITIISIVVLGTAVFFLSQTPYVARIGLQVFDGRYLSGSVSSFGLLGLSEKKLAVEGDLGDYATRGNTTAVIVKDPATNVQQVLLLKPEKKTLTTDTAGKAALAISENGDRVAYASLTNAPEGALFSTRFSAWTITLIEVESGEVITLGQGFAPQFFTKDGKELLLFTGVTGITIVDMEAQVSNTTFFTNPGIIDYSARVSENGEYIAIPNGLTKNYDLFAFTRITAPIGITPLGQIPEFLSFATFKGNILYAIERTGNDTATLVSFNPKNLKRTLLETLPPDAFYRIIQ